mgnify:CR=1 FL=1|nr:MAG TPA: hypothetical protein [Herelleviridae sp.]
MRREGTPMPEYITREEHEEFRKRMEDEDHRQNRRIEIAEESIRQISDLTASVREMAVNMGNMAEQMGKQNDRLDVLEKEPVNQFHTIRTAVLTAIITCVATAVVSAVINAI